MALQRKSDITIQISTSEQIYTTGLTHMPSSTSQSYADTIIESFNKIEDTQSHISNLQNNQSSTGNMKVDNVVLDSFFCGLHPLDSFSKNAFFCKEC